MMFGKFGGFCADVLRDSKNYVVRHSPTICTYGGMIGIVGSSVWLVASSFKAKDDLNGYKEDLQKIFMPSEEQSEPTEEQKKDMKKAKKHIAWTMVKRFAGPVTLQVGSLVLQGVGHSISTHRLEDSMAACVSLGAILSKYREETSEHIGSEEEQKIFDKVVCDVDNQEHKVVESGYKDDDKVFDATLVFDELCPEYEEDAEGNLAFIHRRHSYLDDILTVKGVLLENDIRRELGMRETVRGMTVGYVKTRKDDDVHVNFNLDYDHPEKYDAPITIHLTGMCCVLYNPNTKRHMTAK